MRKNKAEACNRFGTKTKFLNGRSKSFSDTKYMTSGQFAQCKRCDSDYMRFASIDGYCQRCQQRVEYVLRERSGDVRAV